MTARRGVRRPGGHPRRSSRVRRASARISPARAGGALGMLVAVAAIYGATASPAFSLGPVVVRGLHFTDPAEVTARLGVADGVNVFALSTEALAARLADLPAVAAVDIAVQLPDTLDVDVREREAILVWGIGDRRLLVDRDGVLFAEVAAASGDAAGIAAIADDRAASAAFGVGGRLDPIDLDAATRLGSLKPADIGSAAAGLAMAVTDENGFVVRAEPGGWSAVFGFYTPSLRRPDLIPAQVRLLHSLLAGRELNVDRVILASDTSGTYIPRPSPKGSATPRP